jgi:hypothetical protein
MKPFENADTANDAIRDFFKGVTALREKFNIRQVLCGVIIDVEYPEGKGQGQTFLRLGDQFHDLPLAAYLYGEVEAEHRMIINMLRSGGEAAQKAGGRKPLQSLFKEKSTE